MLTGELMEKLKKLGELHKRATLLRSTMTKEELSLHDATPALLECADLLIRFVRDYENPNISDREFRIELTVQATSALNALHDKGEHQP